MPSEIAAWAVIRASWPAPTIPTTGRWLARSPASAGCATPTAVAYEAAAPALTADPPNQLRPAPRRPVGQPAPDGRAGRTPPAPPPRSPHPPPPLARLPHPPP